MKQLRASIYNAPYADSIPVLVRVVRPKKARDKRPNIPDRVKQAEDLPSPELIKAALQLWRDIRETGVVSEKECLYHIAWHILSLADHRVLNSPVLDALEDQMEMASAQDKDNVQRQLEKEADRIIAATLREYGEAEMAYFYEKNRVEFHRLYNEGRRSSPSPSKARNAGDSALIHAWHVRRSRLKALPNQLANTTDRHWPDSNQRGRCPAG